MNFFHRTKMILQPGIIIFIALTFVLPVLVEGKIILDGISDSHDLLEEILDSNITHTPKPAFMIDVTGGKGFIVMVTNIGEVNATNVTCNITIEGGLFMSPKDFSGLAPNIGIGQNFTLICLTKGIGIGIFIPMPIIKINVNCTEGINATLAVQAKIFFSMVTLQ
jgi:hypothetical protein